MKNVAIQLAFSRSFQFSVFSFQFKKWINFKIDPLFYILKKTKKTNLK
jgi:hypothetical protein